MPPFQPAYIEAYTSGVLQKRVDEARNALAHCTICPRRCGVNRLEGETGVCKTGRRANIASYSPHFGEEAPLVGTYGSGTIFFSYCNLGCNFCQNSDISHEGYGVEVDSDHLARIMINLQDMGCHNINLVTPSHVIPQLLSALVPAVRNGLEIPLVYNTSGYDRVESLRLLEGIVDIYLPDFKFWDSKIAAQTCNASDYPEVAKAALLEMYRQVGDLQIYNGRAIRGLLVRHLVLPYGLAGTREIADFISKKISKSTYLNVMAQFRPGNHGSRSCQLDRGITEEEFAEAVKMARNAGLSRLN